jgi:dolichyl-phosphate-mannose-protein mannosyltransferase
MYRLDYFSLRGDESFTVLFVEKPFGQMWNEILTVEPNPPVLYLLLRGWVALAGAGEFATRYFSVFWGVLCVALIYKLAKNITPTQPAPVPKSTPTLPSPVRLDNTEQGRVLNALPCLGVGEGGGSSRASQRRMGEGEVGVIGVLAAFLIAINPYQIWHSQDVRNYTLWPALSLVALILFWQWRNAVVGAHGDRRESPWDRAPLPLVCFVLAELAALYTHYYEAFTLLALNIYVLLFVLRRVLAGHDPAGEFGTTGESNSPSEFAKSPRRPGPSREFASSNDNASLSLALRERIKKWLPTTGQWAAAQIVIASLYLPFPLILSNRVAAYGEGSGEQGVALWDIWQRTFTSFTLGETIDPNWSSWLWIPLALAFGAIFIWRWRREGRGVFFLLYAGVPTLAVFVLNLTRPLFLERYLNGIAPAYYLLFAWGIGMLASAVGPKRERFEKHSTQAKWQGNRRKHLHFWDSAPSLASRFQPAEGPGAKRSPRWGTALATVALVVSMILAALALSNYFYNPAYAKSPDWRGLARAIDAGRQGGDIILQNFPETSLVYYDHSRLPLVVYPTTFLPDRQTPQALTALNAKYRRVWFIPAAQDYWDPNHAVENWLDRHDDLLSETRVGTFRLELYATPLAFAGTMQPASATFGGFAELVGWRLQRQEPAWRVVLYWRAATTTKKNYNLVVQLRDASDNIVSQSDDAPVVGTFPTNQWSKNELIVDEHDLSPGGEVSALAIAMYDASTSTRLPVIAEGEAQGDALLIPLASAK